MIVVSMASQTLFGRQLVRIYLMRGSATYDVDNVELPPDISQAYWVNELVECGSSTTECLRQPNSLRTVHEWEHLRNVDISHGMHDGVKHIVDEDHAHDRSGGLVVLGLRVILPIVSRPESQEAET